MRTPRLTAGLTIAVATALLVSGCSLLSPALPATEADNDFGTVTLYDVLTDGTLDPEPEGLTAEVWDTFTRVTTMDFAADVMLQYRTGDAPESDTLAYVYQDYDNPKLWILAANLATSEDHEQLVATLIHEYGHILTLEQSEMDGDTESCPTLDLDEGCAGDESMLRAFYDEFWAGYAASAPDASNTDADVAYDFYLEHEDDFVSDYAATNVVEDLAETFMTFVLEDEASGDSVIARKLAFFADYPAMVDIRERIRGEFSDDLGIAP